MIVIFVQTILIEEISARNLFSRFNSQEIGKSAEFIFANFTLNVHFFCCKSIVFLNFRGIYSRDYEFSEFRGIYFCELGLKSRK